MSKVSVVVPIYNAGEKLHKCIKSIINQSFKELELVLVNDGSTDNSLEICQKYTENDKRIILIDKKNEGHSATRKKGIEASSGPYIMFVDADDWISSKMIEVLYNELMDCKAEIIVCNMYRVYGFIKQLNKSVYFEREKTYYHEEVKMLATAYFHGHPFPSSLWGKLYKRELLVNSGNYLDRIRFLGEDLFYNLEMLLKTNKVKVINKPFYYYRYGGGSHKFMPYFFEDVINGYEIQKEIINKYYTQTRQNEINGISIVLLNMFRSGLLNLFMGKFSESEIKEKILNNVVKESIIECLDNEGVIRCLSPDYLNAIRNKDIQYLYLLGEKTYKRRKPKQVLTKIVSNFNLN
ncbi:glycosyltransferase family 2 protein [Metabacillus sp. 84]|uniref:glycosyltransferase family 2 protein n=1 Tax=unclassified Metabacillus TaxID=2675274 RepID=UPI003CF95C93